MYLHKQIHRLKIRSGFNNAPGMLVLVWKKPLNYTVLPPNDCKVVAKSANRRRNIYLHAWGSERNHPHSSSMAEKNSAGGASELLRSRLSAKEPQGRGFSGCVCLERQ